MAALGIQGLIAALGQSQIAFGPAIQTYMTHTVMF